MILNTTGLPEEIGGEVAVFNIRNNEIERVTSEDEDIDVEPPLTKKQRQNTKKSKINMKWQKQQIQTQTFSSFDQDKNAQAVFLENVELVKMTMWTSFEKIVSPLIELLLHETKEYANMDKNKPQFKVTLEELKNFRRHIFLSGNNIRLAERDYWKVDPDLRCDIFCETVSRKRFFEIKSFLHAADNQSLRESRMAKIEPLYDLLNEKIQQGQLKVVMNLYVHVLSKML